MMSLKRKIINTNDNKKRTKTTKDVVQQTNTLLNYFKSTSTTSISEKQEKIEKVDVIKSPVQVAEAHSEEAVTINEDNFDEDLLNEEDFAILESQIEEGEGDLSESMSKKTGQVVAKSESIRNSESKDAWMKIFSRKSPTTSSVVETNDADDGYGDEKRTNIEEKPARKCPFYKKIENTPITVDAFNYGTIDQCKAYFLTHFHYDHYIGLNKNWFKQKLYCSDITANLVKLKLNIDKSYITTLPLNKFLYIFEDDSTVRVALVDANHCPGSIMVLFHLTKTNKFILHTGDFRYNSDVINDSMNKLVVSNNGQQIKIDLVYLDTTYLDSYYKFSTQDLVIKTVVNRIRSDLASEPKTLIVCGSYLVGKEKIFVNIAKELDLKIYVTKDKKKILDCLNDSELSKRLTVNANESNLHVLNMHYVYKIDMLIDYFRSFSNMYKRVIGIKPTGWSFNSDSIINVDASKKNAMVYGLAYSEHSSFEELKQFIQYFKPKRVIPTVNNARKLSRDKMTKFINEWLK